MRYMVDDSIPTDKATRQAIADEQHSPRRDSPKIARCLSKGDVLREAQRTGALNKLVEA